MQCAPVSPNCEVKSADGCGCDKCKLGFEAAPACTPVSACTCRPLHCKQSDGSCALQALPGLGRPRALAMKRLPWHSSAAPTSCPAFDWCAPLQVANTTLSLATTTSPAAPVTVGAAVTFTLTVTNTGAAPALGVALNVTLPAGVTWALTPSAGTCDAATGACALGELAAGTSVTVPAVGTPAAAGTLASSGIVAAINLDSCAAPGCTSTASVEVVAATP